jgi:hypothetical protein
LSFFGAHALAGGIGGAVGYLLGNAATGRAFNQEEFVLAVGMGVIMGMVGAADAWEARSCFAAGTPILMMIGYKLIEHIEVGDKILTRSDIDPLAPLQVTIVEAVFVRVGRIWDVHDGDQVIQTTGEHKFYVRDCGWVAVQDLKVGDEFISHDGQWTKVQKVYDTGNWETVYNIRVAECHTYFVGTPEWQFSVWAHNAYGDFAEELGIGRRSIKETEMYRRGVLNANDPEALNSIRSTLQRRGYSEEQVDGAMKVIEADAANPLTQLADLAYHHAAYDAINNPDYHGHTVEAALHIGPDGTITIKTAASGRRVSFDPVDYPSLRTQVALEDGRPPLTCGLPRAAQAVADAVNPQTRVAPSETTYVTDGGFRYNPDTGVLTYYPGCRNCGGITVDGYRIPGTIDNNPHLQRLQLPFGIPEGLQPEQRRAFQLPRHWEGE